MSYRVPSALMLLLVTASGGLAATTADAQSSGRYLTWANRPASTTPADVQAVQSRLPNDFIPRRVAPSQGQARPVMQQPPTQSITASQGLTPASAWLGPRVAPAYAPGTPNPVAYAAAETAGTPLYPPSTSAASTPVATPPSAPSSVADPMAPRRDAPVFSTPRPTTYSPMPQAPAADTAPVAAAPADPMAPRRDARIFQMQQPQPAEVQQAAPTSAASVQSGQSGSRYYSVHRAAGRTPDPTALPEPVYFDSVSVDLAEPPEVEMPLRDAQGRRRAVANVDPSLP